jgi:hypothetical protein
MALLTSRRELSTIRHISVNAYIAEYFQRPITSRMAPSELAKSFEDQAVQRPPQA